MRRDRMDGAGGPAWMRPLRPNRPSGISGRVIALIGAAVAVAVAVVAGGLIAAGGPNIDASAKATGTAVRLDPPAPEGGFRPDSLYVALYGHPGSSVLGALGEQGVAAAVERAQLVASQYLPYGRPVIPTFEIITTVASSEPGEDGDYSNEFASSKFEPWIDAAARHEMHVILDLQSGRSTFPSQAAEIESLLVHPHVSLALDPEWRVGPTQRPGGGFVGTVTAAEVNETVAFLDDLVRRNSLPPKMLVVHHFTPTMVTGASTIRGTDNVTVLFQMDGFGTLPLKVSSWERMVANVPPGTLTGWKNFYDEDQPTPTPAQSLAVVPRPNYISYQ